MRKLLVAALACSFIAVSWYVLALRPVDAGSDKRARMEIEQGMAGSQIAALLEKEGVIRSPLAFRIYTRLHGVANALQAGTFILRPTQSVSEIVETLRSGKAEEAIITIPEGFTVSQIDALLVEKGFSEAGDILRCARECAFADFSFLPDGTGLAERGGRIEGYLFPDTYYVTQTDFSAEAFLGRVLRAFKTKVLDPHAKEFASATHSLHEIVTMASLVEEETRTDDERPIVSGILWKRADDGRGLGVDATVRYIINKPTDAITTTDLNTNSPYNTRKFKGLPPGPIASPGLKSILATLHPEESPYWYYLHGKDGVIHYAVSNEEHNINRYNYLR